MSTTSDGRTYVFVGPTLPAEEVRDLLPGAVIRPPLAAGDLWPLPISPGDVLAVVDGYFLQQRSVRHKELLALIDRGIRVAGAGSMGALRAAELHDFGMHGVGQVFEWYRDGTIEGDDEVAVLHGLAEDGYLPVTRALVDVRASLREAVGAGSLTQDAATEMLAALVEMPFTERDDRGILRRIAERLGPVSARDFQQARRRHDVDIKAADARALLRSIAAGGPPAPAEGRHSDHIATSDVTRTVVYLSWQSREVPAAAHDDAPTRSLALACARILTRDYPVLHGEVAVASALADARDEGVTVPGTGPPGGVDEEATLRRLLHVRGLLDHPDAPIDELVGPWLTDEEGDRAGTLERLRIFVRRTHTAPWRSAQAVAELERLGRLSHWSDVASRVRTFDERLLQQRPDFRGDRIPVERMRQWCADRWLYPGAVPGDREWSLALADRGYARERHWLADARAVHPFAALRSASYDDLDRV